jgi:hypothetical protein
VTASGNDARMRRWRYRQLITYHHDHRQLTDVEFKEQAAQELAMLDYLWTSGATADDYGQFEDRTGIAMDQRLAADVLRGLREARALMDGLRTESRGTPTGTSAPGQRHSGGITELDTPEARAAEWRWRHWKAGRATVADLQQALQEVLQATGQTAEHVRESRSRGARAERARQQLLNKIRILQIAADRDTPAPDGDAAPPHVAQRNWEQRHGVGLPHPAERRRQIADATALVNILRHVADPVLHWRRHYLRTIPRSPAGMYVCSRSAN